MTHAARAAVAVDGGLACCTHDADGGHRDAVDLAVDGVADVVEQFLTASQGGDLAAVTEACLRAIPLFTGGRGAVIELRGMDEPCREVFQFDGVSETAARTIRASGFQFGHARTEVEAIRTIDLREDEQFDGTFLKSVLTQEQIGSIALIPIRASAATTGGMAWILQPEGVPARPGFLRCTRLLIGRYIAIVDRMAQDSRSTAWNAQLRAVLDGAMDGIACVDREGRVVALNRAAAQIFARSERDILYRPIDMLVPSIEAQIREAAAREPDNTGRVFGSRLEVEGVRGDGAHFPIELSLSEASDGSGLTLVMRDLSERKRVERQVAQADRLAAIGTLAAGLGHDMNNMLFPIRAHLNALSVPPRRLAADRRAEHLAEIRSSVSYLQHLADALHFLAMDPEAESDGPGGTDIAEWWSYAGALLGKAVGKRAALAVVIDPELPRAAVARHGLTRAVLNVLMNAAEAMPRGRSLPSPLVTLRARLGEDAATVVVEVEDNGIGMTPEVRRRALDLFFTTKPRGLGTGLGLAMVRGIVQRAGGQLLIESTPEVGTTVRLSFPAVVPEASEVRLFRAALRIMDGRLATVVRGLLEHHGLQDEPACLPVEADCWIAEGRSFSTAEGRSWACTRAPATLVLLGPIDRQTRQELAAIGTTIVDDHRDIEQVRAGIFRAVQALGTREQGKEQSHD